MTGTTNGHRRRRTYDPPKEPSLHRKKKKFPQHDRWPTLERRRIIKQATTFYKILNNIIEITPPPGLLTRSRTRGQYIAPKCRINAMVFSFYPRAIRIWNMIPSKITNIKNPKSFQEAIMELPFTTPPHLNCL